MPLKKRLLTPGSRSTPLLPNLSEAKKLLGLTTSFARTCEQLAIALETELPLSRATLYKLNDIEGLQKVSSKSRGGVTKFLQQASLIANSPGLRLPNEEEYTGGAAETGWIGVITSLKHAESSFSEWWYLIAFVEQRISLETSVLNQISHSDLSQERLGELYFTELRSRTLIPEEALHCVRMIVNEQHSSYSEKQLASWHCSSKLDFYFSAAALLELGWLNRLRQASPEMAERKPTWFDQGIIRSFIQPLVIEDATVELRDSFKLFLKWLKDEIGTSPSRNRITNSELASYIPLERELETANGYFRKEKQLDLLKAWRKGNFPSHGKFQNFIRNLRNERQSSLEVDFLTDIGMVVMALDRLFSEIVEDLKTCNSTECYEAFNRALKQYPKYYLHFQAIYKQKQET
ncbi:hypothetical protein ACR0ST_08740 [Aliidiomarina sp. Khilg15.8]